MQLQVTSFVQQWNAWEIQLMVLLSFALQLFLFFTGGLRRRKTNMLLRLFIWLAYVGADLVAVYALGLLSRHEDKHRRMASSMGMEPMVFFWAPFLLVHLGGQDTITAYSIEDNNLWPRHLLNLVVQVSLALYVFWKSMGRMKMQLTIQTILIFIAGIIKYGERIWALKCGSQESLRSSNTKAEEDPLPEAHKPSSSRLDQNLPLRQSTVLYALQTVLYARGMLGGRTLFEMGHKIRQRLVQGFGGYERQAKHQIIQMELGMMYDVLYTKAMVLRTSIGSVLRCVAHISTITALVLFVATDKSIYSKVDVGVTYALLIGGLFMEVCANFMMMLSPWWTWVQLRQWRIFYWVSHNARSISKCIRHEEMEWPNSVGQFNLYNSAIRDKSTVVALSKIMDAVGLKDWRHLPHIKHIKDKGIIEFVVDWFDRSSNERFRQIAFGQALNYTLSLSFEHAIIRLHIFTDLHISKYFDSADSSSRPADIGNVIKVLVEDCEKLSNYMMYLLAVQPSVLPVSSTAAQDVLMDISSKIQNSQRTSKLEILGELATETLCNERPSPFDDTMSFQQSFVEIKEMWIRLIVYAAGKCRAELHARNLGNGGELLTFAWLLMAHLDLGDLARGLNLVASDDPEIPRAGSVVPVDNACWIHLPEGPRYAFDFRNIITRSVSQ